MTKKRDTVTYELKRGHEVVYVGTTNGPEERERDHERSGKRFDRMNVTSKKMTEEGAMKKEQERLKRYRQNHQGKNPKYNRSDNG